MILFCFLNESDIKEYFLEKKSPKNIMKEMMSSYKRAKLHSILGPSDKNKMSYKSQGHEIYFHHKEENRKHREQGIEQQLKTGEIYRLKAY